MIEFKSPVKPILKPSGALPSGERMSLADLSKKLRKKLLDKRPATLTPTPRSKVKEPVEQVQISRWRLKHTVSNILRSVDEEKTPGVCKCGTAGYNSEAVSLIRNGNKAGVRGVFFCDSPWLCPTCAPRRAAQRAEKVTEVFNAVEKKRGRIVFVTLTVKHGKRDSLTDLKTLVLTACRKARQGKPWALAIERYDIAGSLVGPEVTWSEKYGWHFHLHVALVVMKDSEAVAQEAGEWLMNRYRNYIHQAGGKTSRQAQDVTVIWRKEDISSYLAKGSAAWEVSNAGATKESGATSLTPWDLAVLAGRGDAQSAKLFQEYAVAMPGTRSCVITKSLASKLSVEASSDEDKPGVDETNSSVDDEVESSDPKDEVEVVGVMDPSRWHRVLRNGYAADVLKVVSDGWNWPDIDKLIAKMLGEDHFVDEFKRSIKPKVHALSVLEFVSMVRYETYKGRASKGQALQIVITNEREYASRKGLMYIQPNLKSVMELLADF